MFKNLLDKAKSAIEDIDVSLKNGPPPKPAKKLMEYDSNFFTFTLEGGPLHTSTIRAIAKIRLGENAGEPLPMTCKWFISTIDGKMNEIQGLEGPVYEPCAEDVGSRIVVQVTPALPEAKYTGMPVFGEVGPLVLDQAVEEKVMAFLNGPVADYKITIESMSFDIENKPETFPCQGFVSLNKQQKTIEVFSANGEEKATQLAVCQHSDQYPSIEFMRDSNVLFELQFSQAKCFKMAVESSLDRDVLATAVRMFGNEDLLNSEETEEKEKPREIKNRKRTVSSNLQILMKREKLIKQIKQLEKDNADIKKELEDENDIKLKLQTQVNGLTNQLKEKDSNIALLHEEIAKMRNEKECLNNEKLFLTQEVNLFRSQTVELETVIKGFESHSNKSRESIEKESNSSEMEETLKSLKARLITAELSNEQLQQEQEQLNQRLATLEQSVESKDAHINGLKKKVQSLVQENEKANNNNKAKEAKEFDVRSIPMPPLCKSTSYTEEVKLGLSNSPKKRIFEPIIDSFQTHAYEDEIKQLKQTNEKLTSTIEELKLVDSPTRRKGGSLFDFSLSKSRETDTIEHLQKVINNLTEVISEKDLHLESQKKMNKELAKRIFELEQSKVAEKSF